MPEILSHQGSLRSHEALKPLGELANLMKTGREIRDEFVRFFGFPGTFRQFWNGESPTPTADMNKVRRAETDLMAKVLNSPELILSETDQNLADRKAQAAAREDGDLMLEVFHSPENSARRAAARMVPSANDTAVGDVVFQKEEKRA